MESCLKEEDSSPEETTGVEIKKCCSACKTSTTPLWRSGPTGPKALCNACGIRHRKKKGGPNTATGDVKKKIGKTRKLVPLGWVVEEGRRRRGEPEPEPEPEPAKNPTRWGEVERAALLLMALSCGVVFG